MLDRVMNRISNQNLPERVKDSTRMPMGSNTLENGCKERWRALANSSGTKSKSGMKENSGRGSSMEEASNTTEVLIL